MMHYTMVHSRLLDSKWIVFEEAAWYRCDRETLRDLSETYKQIGFTTYELDRIAADGTMLLVMHSPGLGWRVAMTRE